MVSTMKLILALATVLGVAVTTVNSMPPKKQNFGNRICDGNFEKNQLQNTAQQALEAIHTTRTLTASNKLADRGQHVFNNNLLKFHRSVLQDLLEDLKLDDQIKNLEQHLTNPLDQNQQDAISTTMVAYFSPDEGYVDYNAAVYGAYVEKLRHELVKYLKADIFDNEHEKIRTSTEVQFIADEMVNRNVFVDPMACDHWLKKDQNKHTKQFNEIRAALKEMIQNIPEHFRIVSEKIKNYYKTNNWNR